MAKTYVKGNPVANATSYELFENVSGVYTSLATANEINFEVSALNLAAGDHKLAVKAKADGYEDSDYSNELTYTVAEGPYWIAEKLGNGTIGSGSATSMLSTQYFYIDNEDYVAELSGKTVESIAFCTANKTASGNIILSLVDLNNPLPTSWEDKATFAFNNAEPSTIATVDLETPFTIPAGYTIGYRSSVGNIFGGGSVVAGYTRKEKYYNTRTATSSSEISLGGFDCKVSAS
jgi:hypothetical protein